MTKLTKRTVAFLIMVCMLSAMVVPATAFAPVAAEADGSYVYDFVAAMDLERSNGASISTYGAQNAPVPESNTVAQEMWNGYYEDGSLNWSYPQVPGTGGNGKTAEDVVLNDANGGAQFYNGDHLLAKLGTADTVAWFVLKIKAPIVGKYDVTVEHKAANNNGVREGKIHFVPAFELGDAESFDAAAYNAEIDAIVASGEYVLDGVIDCDSNTTASNLQADVGSVVLDDINAKEYFVIFSADLSESDTANGVRFYLQSLTLSPAEDTAPVSGNYTFTNSTNVSLANGALATMAEQYAAGSRDLKVVGHHSGVTNGTMSASMFNFGYTMYSAKDPKWVAVQVRIPADGTYNIALNSGTVSGTDLRTGTPVSAYMVNAADFSGTDYTQIISDETSIGKADFGTGNQRGDFGYHDLKQGEYVIVFKAEASDPLLWSGDGAKHANNFYFTSMEFNAFAAQLNGEKYETVSAAAVAAGYGDTIQLLADYVGNIDLPAGVSIDLNGHNWTVSEYIAASVGEYVFNSLTDGVWKVGTMSLYDNNNGFVPLYDEEAGGYRFFMLGITVVDGDIETVGNATRFWFKVEMPQADAVDLVKGGKTGLTFGANLTWGDKTLDATFDNGNGVEAFAAEWATAYENSSNLWLYVDVTGVENLTEVLHVEPVVEIAGNELTAGELVYNLG